MNYDNIDIAEDTFDIDFNCSYVNNCPTIQEIDKFQTYFDSYEFYLHKYLDFGKENWKTIETLDDFIPFYIFYLLVFLRSNEFGRCKA